MIVLILAALFALTSPCEYEDSPNCYWDGGDTGSSFVDIGGTAYYLP